MQFKDQLVIQIICIKSWLIATVQCDYKSVLQRPVGCRIHPRPLLVDEEASLQRQNVQACQFSRIVTSID